MSKISNQEVHIVMDVGGTNVRIGSLDETASINNIEAWLCRDFPDPEAVLSTYFEKYELRNPHVCMAIASPIEGDQISMINHSWSFSKKALQAQFSLASLNIINDYHATAMSVNSLTDDEITQVGGGEISRNQPYLVCGIGTGLGVAIATRFDNKVHVLPGEGGHVDFAPNSDYEVEIWKYFQSNYGHVSAERILSGPGLKELYQAICMIEGLEYTPRSAEEISELGANEDMACCAKTLKCFCEMFGSFCGNIALITSAFGGIYIGGGVVPSIKDYFIKSNFRERFEQKGRYRSFNEKIPTFIITQQHPGLIGAANYLLENF